MSVIIKAPDAGSTVSGNPLKVTVHYNTTEGYCAKSVLKKVAKLLKYQKSKYGKEALAANFWRLSSSVGGVQGTTGSWAMEKVVSATGGGGADWTFDFRDGADPIPDGTYEVAADLCYVVQLGGVTMVVEHGSDSQNPVYVDTH
jgi:hypothetical protein